ncbi:hypothetical protein Tco_0780113 [Tanacetum coccineum]
MAFIQLGGNSRVDEMILARVSSGFAGQEVWEDIQVVPGFLWAGKKTFWHLVLELPSSPSACSQCRATDSPVDAHLSPHVSHHTESLYHPCLTPMVTIAVFDVPGDGSRGHTHDHDRSEAPDGSPNSILSSEPKPLGKHKPPPYIQTVSREPSWGRAPTRRSPAEGSDSEMGGDGDGVVLVRISQPQPLVEWKRKP